MNGDLDVAIETQTKAVALLPPGRSADRIEIESNLMKYLLEGVPGLTPHARLGTSSTQFRFLSLPRSMLARMKSSGLASKRGGASAEEAPP